MGYKCIHRTEIDQKKWQTCVRKSDRHRLYNQFWYLDIVCNKQWQALIWDDYRAVFPLPISGKFGLSFLQNPNLVQQLDILGDIKSSDYDDCKRFIDHHYKFIAVSTSTELFKNNSITRSNLILDTKSYVFAKVGSTLRNNLKKASKSQLQLKEVASYHEGLAFLKTHFHLTGVNPSEQEWMFYERVMKEVEQAGKAKFVFVLKDQVPIQFAFWIVEEYTAYYFLNISNEEGRACGASHFAIDAFIRTLGRDIQLIDFEGSSIEGVKRFYKSFGAQEEHYFLYKNNRLPFFLKWFKK